MPDGCIPRLVISPPERRVRDAVATLRSLPPSSIPPQVRAVVPLAVVGSARSTTPPSAHQIAQAWEIVIALSIAVGDHPAELRALWLDGCGMSLRRSARIMCTSHTQTARLRSMGLLRLQAFLLSHED